MTRPAHAVRQTDNASPVPAAEPSARAVQSLARAGRHVQAVEAASQALVQKLAQAPRGIHRTLQLLELRCNSLLAVLELPRAEADAQAMLALAQRSRSAAHRAQALAAWAHVQTRQERLQPALQNAGEALQAARRSRRADLIALAAAAPGQRGLEPRSRAVRQQRGRRCAAL